MLSLLGEFSIIDIKGSGTMPRSNQLGIAIAVMIAASSMSFSAYAARKGVAFAQAPEQSTGLCFGSNTVNTLNCARAKCAAGGAAASDCLRQTWCFPGGWSADIFLQVSEGPHFHEFICGMETRAAAESLVTIKCDKTIRPNLTECSVVKFYNEQGAEFPPN